MLGCYLINSESHDLEELKKTFKAAMDLSEQINRQKKSTMTHSYLDTIINDVKIDNRIALSTH